MNRRIALIGLAALFTVSSAAAQELRPRLPATPVAAAPVIVALEGAERAAALAQANGVLNAVQRMQGRFEQSAPGGARARGTFYLQRPGKMRFEYDAPATLLIVSDGNVVAMRDTALRTTDRTPIGSTPLNLILGARIDLARDARILRVSRSGPWLMITARDARILRVSRSGPWLMITARDRSGQTDGQISLHFWGPSAELRSWDVIDAAGARTRVTLSEMTQPASFDRRLFRLEDMLSNRPGQRR